MVMVILLGTLAALLALTGCLLCYQRGEAKGYQRALTQLTEMRESSDRWSREQATAVPQMVMEWLYGIPGGDRDGE